MKQNIVIVIIGVLFAASCVNQEQIETNNLKAEDVSLVLSDNPDYKSHKAIESLKGDYDKYLEYFVGTDYKIGISSSKDGGLPGGSKISCISGTSPKSEVNETKAVDDLPQIRSFVDGVEIARENILPTKSSSGIIDCFGKVVKFSFNNGSETKSSEDSIGEYDMYVPKAIEFLFPYAEKEEDLNPLCYYKDFEIEWNADENNENGVLVLVDWTGSMVLGEDIPDTHVFRIASFPDTGVAQLPEELFDGIPDTAYCDIMIVRGNIENINFDNYSYKLIGQTYHRISFILVREVEYL